MTDKTTATERLRQLLDERGEHYETSGSRTWWGRPVDSRTGEPINVYLNQAQPTGEDRLCVEMQLATPEQAVEATLGRGTCEVDVLNTGDCAGYECSEYIMHCNGCGHEFGHVLYNEDGDVWMSEPPRFCPNCGRRVVNEQ